ncbi:MAG: sugar transferase [Syntrophomonadaceae bacterium]|nr:sugar transferase [Syntrophomonadaceae bacterium]
MRWTLAGKFAGDAIFFNAGYLLAFLIRFGGELPKANWEAFLATSPYITVIALILFYGYGLYTPGRRRFEEIFASLFCALAITFLAAITLSYMLHQFAFPRTVFLISAPLQLLLLGLWRWLAWDWSRKRMGPLRLVVIGSPAQAVERARQISQAGEDMYQVAVLITVSPEATLQKHGEGAPGGDAYSELAAAIDHKTANGILFCQDVPREIRIALMSQAAAQGLSIFVIPDTYEIILSNSRLDQMDGIPVFRLTGFAPNPSLAWERLTDVALAMVIAVLSLPVMLLAAIAIKLETPQGPILFRQERVGQGGKVFQLYKLRTMVPDAEKLTGPVLATDKDPRITKVGRVLRFMRIDELPQLYNVLFGNMSFVGPRPERPFFVEQFRREVPGYDYRHQIKVGITGLAQVEGKYSTSVEDKLCYDLIYAKTKSPLKDLQILLHTIKVMLMRSKAS